MLSTGYLFSTKKVGWITVKKYRVRPAWNLRPTDDDDLPDLAVDVTGLLDVLQEHLYCDNKAERSRRLTSALMCHK
jgi:hypothetical protein